MVKKLVIIITALIGVASIFSMQQSEKGQFSLIPSDVQKIIVEKSISQDTPQETVDDIKNYLAVNKALYSLWNNQKFVNGLITLLSNNFTNIDVNEHRYDYIYFAKRLPNNQTVNQAAKDYNGLLVSLEKKDSNAVRAYMNMGISPAYLLFDAIKKSDFDKIQLLIDSGMNPNVKDMLGRTGLMYSASKGNQAVIHELIAKGANLNAQDDTGFTALMLAVKPDNQAMVELLVKAGANVNLQNEDGRTALHMAATFLDNPRVIARLLLDEGADVSIKDNKGRTASDLSIQYGQGKLAQLITEYKEQ